MGASVVGRGDGSESFLTGGIPLLEMLDVALSPWKTGSYDLQLDSLAVEFNGSDFLHPRQPALP
jgi:hypothetical protein